MLKRTKPAGYASTYGFTTAEIVTCAVGVLGSLVSSVTALEIGPAKFVVSTCAETLPVWPGLTILSKSATVQPQVGFAERISRSAEPVFLISNDQSIFSPLGTVPKSLSGSVSVRRGALVASAVAFLSWAT